MRAASGTFAALLAACAPAPVSKEMLSPRIDWSTNPKRIEIGDLVSPTLGVEAFPNEFPPTSNDYFRRSNEKIVITGQCIVRDISKTPVTINGDTFLVLKLECEEQPNLFAPAPLFVRERFNP